MPTDEEMPTPEGPLAPISTYSRSAATPQEHGDQSAAVQHIYDGETQLLDGETPELFPPQPTESESLFGDRSSAGPMCLDDESEFAFVSETSAGLTRGLPSAHRSIGNDLTNLDQVGPGTATPMPLLKHHATLYLAAYLLPSPCWLQPVCQSAGEVNSSPQRSLSQPHSAARRTRHIPPTHTVLSTHASDGAHEGTAPCRAPLALVWPVPGASL